MADRNTILVTGATGRVGGSAVAQLSGTGAAVRALTRNPGAARLPAEVVGGDLADPDSLDAALDGVGAVLLVFPTLAADHAADALIAKLAEQGRRIVYLSAAGVEEATDGILASHARVEALLERSGAEWTFLRAGGFAANTLMWADQIRAGDVVRGFHGAASRALIHEDDIAAVAVRALIDDGHAGGKYHLTGPARLTQVEQVEAIGAALGRKLRFEELPPEVAVRELFPGFDEEIARGIVDAHAAMVEHPEPITTTVERITGAPARTFQRWAVDHAGDFR
ncbi:SDR family oxidoreductase [Actinokineospora sp. UTMC 2448]|uniref:SDR family oxidoreductase n=1 Tax=Actinokineospora sp. UTMC 2448 TaxID=2268449 RepID=UPI0021645C8C|nr:NAD(P)H-binding protein [Actinokineospora sp. UTMC 2448]UVS77612.1 NAD(P)H azoreductase [Actinokineospora sp. UTMC 2448]